MKILILSGRGHELEFEIFAMPEENALVKGVVTGIGVDTSILNYTICEQKKRGILDGTSYFSALRNLEKVLVENGIIISWSDIQAVGHRVVHGGKKLLTPVIINQEVLDEIRNAIELAPLHNKYNYECIQAAMKALPGIPHAAIFDTAFHSTMPEHIKRYAIPDEFYKNRGIHKHGFHGISHEYITERTAQLLGKKKETINLISCHLGKGGSVNAIKNGQSYDISMGFTPVDGLIMSTRCGEIDAGAVLYLMKTGLSLCEVETLLNKWSGLLGLSDYSDKMEELIEKRDEPKIKLVLDMYAYRVRKYIGAYLVNLGDLEALSFTGGIGTNSPIIRSMICANLGKFGIDIDEKKNEAAVGCEAEISKGPVRIFVIPRNSKLMIARKTYRLVC